MTIGAGHYLLVPALQSALSACNAQTWQLSGHQALGWYKD